MAVEPAGQKPPSGRKPLLRREPKPERPPRFAALGLQAFALLIVVIGVVALVLGPSIIWLIAGIFGIENPDTMPAVSDALGIAALTGIISLMAGMGIANASRLNPDLTEPAPKPDPAPAAVSPAVPVCTKPDCEHKGNTTK